MEVTEISAIYVVCCVRIYFYYVLASFLKKNSISGRIFCTLGVVLATIILLRELQYLI
jgi:lipopolysaccharide export LptBFGC system permease protein LptF